MSENLSLPRVDGILLDSVDDRLRHVLCRDVAAEVWAAWIGAGADERQAGRAYFRAYWTRAGELAALAAFGAWTPAEKSLSNFENSRRDPIEF